METQQNEIDYELEVGLYTSLCPKTLFMIEDEQKQLCGYVAATPNNNLFTRQIADKWLPELKEKYTDLKDDLCIHHEKRRMRVKTHF